MVSIYYKGGLLKVFNSGETAGFNRYPAI